MFSCLGLMFKEIYVVFLNKIGIENCIWLGIFIH